MTVNLPIFENFFDVVRLKQLRDGLVELHVQGVFQLLDLGGLGGNDRVVFLQILHTYQQAVGHFQQGASHLQQMGVRLDVVDANLFDRGPGIVCQIVDGGGQAVEVVPVDGRNEGAVDVIHQFPPDGVRLLFLDLDEVSVFLGGGLTEDTEGLHSVPDDLGLLDQKTVEIKTFFPLEHGEHSFFKKSGKTRNTK